MRRFTPIWLAFVLLGAAVPAIAPATEFVLLGAAAPAIAPATESAVPENAVGEPGALARRQPDTVRRNTGNQAGTVIEKAESETHQATPEPDVTERANSEPAETEPLIPIETKNSIRVNANVSLPQDI